MVVITASLFLLILVSLLITFIGDKLDCHGKLSFLSGPIIVIGLISTLLFVFLFLVQMIFVTDVYYNRKAINSMFGTSYTMDEVRLFHNEIKERHKTEFPTISTE